jgi:hypothetical protein
MIIRRKLEILIFATVVAGLAVADEVPPAPESTGEVIVKFAQGQQVNATITEYLRSGDMLPHEVVTFTRDLSSQLGIPFEASRITSGREIVVAIRHDDLLADLVGRVADHPDVARSRLSDDAGGAPNVRRELLISLDTCSNAHQALSDFNRSGGATESDIREVAGSLAGAVNYPVNARLLPSGELALSVDTNALTVQLARALQERADVAYAQPNFVMRYK